MQEKGLYPLKFLPLFKDKVWGGNKVRDLLSIDYSPLERLGELWVLSNIEGQQTVVENGFLAESTLSDLLEMYSDELVGEENFNKFYTDFPLLIKIIDANSNLSVQVHPDDQYAQKNDLSSGKTEMWYVLQADKGAKIYQGFNTKETKADIINRVRNHNLEEVLHSDTVAQGDLFFIPGGEVHSLGKGVMVAEIQQSSDTTFRIYDWDRPLTSERPLHLDKALSVLDFTPKTNTAKYDYDYKINKTNKLLHCPYFTTNIIPLNAPLKKDLSVIDTFFLYFCVAGKGFLNAMNERVPIKAGEIILIPAICNELIIEPTPMIELIEITTL